MGSEAITGGTSAGSVEVAVRAELSGFKHDLDRGKAMAEQTKAEIEKATSKIQPFQFGSMDASTIALQKNLAASKAKKEADLAAARAVWDAQTNGARGAAEAAAEVETHTATAAISAGELGIKFALAEKAIELGLEALKEIVNFMPEAVAEAEKFAQIQRETRAQLEATGYASGQTAEEIRGLAEELENTTLASGEGVERAAQKMLIFRNVTGDTFRTAIRLANDYASIGFGTLEGNAMSLGRALEYPAEATRNLRQFGINLTEQQRDQIRAFMESGQTLQAQQIIIDEMSKRVGGAGAGATGGLTGAVHALSVAWDNFKRGLGDRGVFHDAIEDLTNLSAAAVNAARRMLAPTRQEELNDTLSMLKKLEEGQAPEDQLETLRRRRDILLTEIRASELVARTDQERADAGKEAADAEAKKTAEMERQRALVPDYQRQEESAVRTHLEVQKSGLAIEDAQNEAAYSRGERSLQEYRAKRVEIQQRGIRAEIEAKKQELFIAEQGVTDGDSSEIAKATEIARIKGEIAVKENELRTGAIEGATAMTSAQNDAIKSAREELAITEALQGVYDGSEESLREMAIQQKALTAAQSAGIAVGSEAYRVLEETIRKNETLNQSLEQRIQIERSLRSVRDEIKGFQDEDLASTMPKADRYAFLKEQELLNEATRQGNVVTEEQARSIKATAAAYGEAKAAFEQFRMEQEAEKQLAGEVVDTLANLGKQLVTDSDNWKKHLLEAFGEIVNAAIRTAGQIAIANQQAQGGGGSGGWLGKILGMVIGAVGGAAGGAAAGGGSFGGGVGTSIANTGVTFSGVKLHGGGIVGSAGVPRPAAVSEFIDAPRYHKGIRELGLGHNERAAILEVGETVIPKGHKMRSGGTVNVWNITTSDSDSFMASERTFMRLGKRRLGVRGQ